MPNDLILKSLEIRQFRGIRELKINRLGRVNLLVGKNNVGKTTVLEALRLYATPGSLRTMVEILSSRDEVRADEYLRRKSRTAMPLQIDSFYHGRKALATRSGAIAIGPLGEEVNQLIIEFQKRTSTVEMTPLLESQEGSDDTPKSLHMRVRTNLLIFKIGRTVKSFSIDRPEVRFDNFEPGLIDDEVEVVDAGSGEFHMIRSLFVPSVGLQSSFLSRLWDEISLSGNEEEVLAAIRLVSPNVERIGVQELMRRSDGQLELFPIRDEQPVRIPHVKLREHFDPIPLRNLGDGSVRLFGTSLALANARGGFLLVDEIENGIHYAAQTDMWRLVFKLALQLNVQVFATTHSYDCIKAFDKVARESEEEGMLIRLASRNGETLVGEFDEDELEIAIEGEIEVR